MGVSGTPGNYFEKIFVKLINQLIYRETLSEMTGSSLKEGAQLTERSVTPVTEGSSCTTCLQLLSSVQSPHSPTRVA